MDVLLVWYWGDQHIGEILLVTTESVIAGQSSMVMTMIKNFLDRLDSDPFSRNECVRQGYAGVCGL